MTINIIINNIKFYKTYFIRKMKKSKKELNRITAALISVSDKTGIKEFAQNLARSGIVIYSVVEPILT